MLAALKAAEAEGKCRALLNTARNCALNGMKDKAQECLDKVIADYPGSKWAEEAQKMKQGL